MSLSSVFVMVVALLVMGSVIFSNALLTTTLTSLQDKVDVNVYFLSTASEPDVLELRQKIEVLPEVKEVEYESRDQVLEEFRVRHANDSTTLQALDELDDNPFGAVLNIRAKETSQYESVARFLESESVLLSNGQNIIEKVNYNQNKVVIEKLSSIIDSSQRIGLVIAIVLIFLSVLITFNTIRLAIYIAREEISVMKLVGANAMYIRGPFVVGGMLYGIIAGIITLILFYPITAWLGSETENFFVNINIFDYYISNFGQIFLMVMLGGIAIGAVSSFLAVRRYLK